MHFLACLIPIGLLTGPAVPDILISILTCLFLYLVFTKNIKKYFKNIYFLFFILFNLYLIINSFFSLDILHSLRTSIVYFRFIFFTLAIWYLLDESPKFEKNFLIAILLAFIVALSNGYFQYFFGQDIFGNGLPKTAIANRLTLFLSTETLLGNYLARMLPLLLGLIFLKKKNNYLYYILVIGLLVFTDVLIYISTERTALGLLFISTLFIIILMKKYRFLRIFSLFSSIIIILLISFLSPELKHRNIDFTIKQLGMSENSEKINIISPQHEAIYKSSWEIFLNNPILGSGVNSFRIGCNWESHYANDNLGCSTHPHNIYVQALAELGIVIFYLFKKVLVHIATLLFRKEKEMSDYQVCLMACFLISLWPFFPTLNLFNNWNNIVYFLPIGFYLHTIYSK